MLGDGAIDFSRLGSWLLSLNHTIYYFTRGPPKNIPI